MKYTARDVLEFVRENDVKFIRLVFCDVFGTQKNLSIMAGELPRAMEKGVPFHAAAISGLASADAPDLLVMPDPSTLAVLPWRPQQGRVARLLCNLYHPDGTPFEADGRQLLQESMRRLHAMGLSIQMGAQCEFYLFETDEKGAPTLRTHDNAGYLDVAPLDKGENMRREICLTLEEMGIQPESSHHEEGPGQNEIDFYRSDPLQTADHLTTFKTIVRNVAARSGLHASFMPKPLKAHSGSGMPVNLWLFEPAGTPAQDELMNAFLAGILENAPAMTAFLNPLTNSYERLGSDLAPSKADWSENDRASLARVHKGDGPYAHLSIQSPDAASNPYLAFTLLLRAGIDGIERGLTLSDKAPAPLPTTLKAALELADKSAFIHKMLPERTIRAYIDAGLAANAARLLSDPLTFDQSHYFGRI